jgi:asparagine synthase (glutamine-hydrolysing)
MCGIFGYSLCSSHRAVDSIGSAELSLAHRGPDSSGSFHDLTQGFALVHTRLSIQDLSSSGNQPMFSPDRSVILVFNGEIYNFRELRAELEINGYPFIGDSDTEVLLALYLSIRDLAFDNSHSPIQASMLSRLNGVFAFALWDQKYESILIARDALGVKPLYLKTDQTGIVFSSELKAFALTNRALNVPALDKYLSFLYCPGSATPLQNVSRLGPGEAMWLSRGHVKSHFKWYQLPVFFNHFVRPLSTSCLSLSTNLENRLRTAVHRQLISDVPVGAFLSGGLDSSSIVAFAKERSPDLPCFTIELSGSGDEGFCDDLPYARRVARHLGLPLEVVQVDSARMATGLEEMVWQLDEPLCDPAPLNVLYISRLAREHGIKVLLSGVGGDDLFTGYRRHLALYSERFWAWLPRRFRILMRELTGQLPSTQPSLRRLRKAFSVSHLEGDARLVHYFRWIDRSDLHALYTPAFRAALGDHHAEDPMLTFLSDLPAETHPIERMLALEQRFFLADHNLVYTDKMSMAAGVEVRVPFLDLDLVEFAARIPSHYKQRGRESKWVLKKAMEHYLPHDVIYRPKTGFGAPLRRWLRVELCDWLADVLSPQRLQSRGLFDSIAVQRLIADNAAGRIDASYTILSLACIEIWCRRFIDTPDSPSLSSPA